MHTFCRVNYAYHQVPFLIASKMLNFTKIEMNKIASKNVIAFECDTFVHHALVFGGMLHAANERQVDKEIVLISCGPLSVECGVPGWFSSTGKYPSRCILKYISYLFFFVVVRG